LALLRSVALPKLQDINQAEPPKLVAPSINDVSQMRARSNEAIARKAKMLPTGIAKLYWLIELYTSGHHDVRTFCKEFERTFNFEVDKQGLSAEELATFGDLFQKVTVYSPYPDELERVPFYQSEAQIRSAVAAAKLALGK
jgi:hypothetical protein